MSAFLRPFLERWRLCALIASLLMLAIAHGFETFGGMAPCALCLRAREVYWVAAALALAGMLVVRMRAGARWRWVFDAGLAAVFTFGVGLAVYHSGVEWKWWPGPTACSGGAGAVSAGQIADLLQGAKIAAPACDKAAWVFLGLSMAGWNALASLGLAVLSLLAVRHERRKAS
ncbi:disulfide bond formation protein DsbB [Phenylobacterium sp. Root77]|uniref:disulfide bond formation protein B n=1 Tax=unclassified Phenylobacterium TaxID=2640670 RepID=UPI0006FE6B25|nr:MULTISPECIES: disulfide bond formation protein B [unclassified Phenylobacterium]KQW73006.1 disulfide bond formation protein DsbB [Phenylobacterium sp. Root1277]KQW92225.1 disulfide bond formation protein DsbB [Phenylobacterium sp. Root1290]KRC40456.1 disulfide bond formation protein DsbB [Phenylobacterium sp. Root77]